MTSAVRRLGGSLVLGLALMAMAGCSSGTGTASEGLETGGISSSAGDVATSQGNVATSLANGAGQVDADSYPWLQVMEGGIFRVPIANGASVPIVDDIVAEVFVSPYPPGIRTDLDLYLLRGSGGSPVTDATVELVSDMVFMDHGAYALSGKSVGEGHYVLPLNFLMYGEWQVQLRVRTADGRESSIWMIWGVFPQEN